MQQMKEGHLKQKHEGICRVQKAVSSSSNRFGAFHFSGGAAGNKVGAVGKDWTWRTLCQILKLLNGFCDEVTCSVTQKKYLAKYSRGIK